MKDDLLVRGTWEMAASTVSPSEPLPSLQLTGQDAILPNKFHCPYCLLVTLDGQNLFEVLPYNDSPDNHHSSVTQPRSHHAA